MSLKAHIATGVLELWYGVKTADHVDAVALGYDSEGERYRYEPSGWLTLWRALPRREVRPDDVLADLGSGKGRVLMQAARRYRFKRVIGVELSPGLHEWAKSNLEASRGSAKSRIELVNEDVLRWQVPDDLTMVYMHNPFLGELFSQAIDRLIEAVDRTGRPLKLIYLNPVEHDRLMATGRARETPLPSLRTAPATGFRPGRVRRYELLPHGTPRSGR
jgi:Methyltransferase domain